MSLHGGLVRTVLEVVLVAAVITAVVGYCHKDRRTQELQAAADSSRAQAERLDEQVDAYEVALDASDSTETALRDSLSRRRAEARGRAERAEARVGEADEDFHLSTVELETALAVLRERAPQGLIPYVRKVQIAVDSMEVAHDRTLTNFERYRTSMERQVALLEEVSASKDRSIAQRDSLIAAQDSALGAYREALADSEELVEHLRGGSFFDLFGSELPKTVAQIGGCFGVSRLLQELTPEGDRDRGFWWKAGSICTGELVVSKSW